MIFLLLLMIFKGGDFWGLVFGVAVVWGGGSRDFGELKVGLCVCFLGVFGVVVAVTCVNN